MSLKTVYHGKCFTTQSFWVLNGYSRVNTVLLSPPEEPLPFRGGAVVQPPCDGVAQVGGSGRICS